MKVLSILKKGFIGLVWVLFFSFAILMTILLLNRNDYGVTTFDDLSLIVIDSELSSDQYDKGELVVTRFKDTDEIMQGEYAFTYKLLENNAVEIQFGEIGKVYPEEDAITFVNGSTYSMELVAGVGIKSYDHLGTFLSIVLSRWGFLFLILVPSLFIFIYQVYALIVEIKYGNEEVK